MSDITFPSKKPVICEVASIHAGQEGAFTFGRLFCDGHVTAAAMHTDERERVTYVGRDGILP